MRLRYLRLLALVAVLGSSISARADDANWRWLGSATALGRHAATTLRTQLERTLPADFLVASGSLDRDLLIAILCRGAAELSKPKLLDLQKKTSGKTNAAELVRILLGELGPGFIKFGQLLGNRPDLLSAKHRPELAKLSDAAPPASLHAVWKSVEEGLVEGAQAGRVLRRFFPRGKRRHSREGRQKVEVFFSKIHWPPAGVGSIGQVHRATLRTGEEVFVKFVKPGVDTAVKANFDVIEAALVAQPSAAPFARLVREERDATQAELDLHNEARNISRAAKYLSLFGIKTPTVVSALSSKNLLVMKRVDGVKITDTSFASEKLRQRGARLVLASVALPMMVLGSYHADPHEGNVFATADGRFSLIDWGRTGRISAAERRRLLSMLRAVQSGDASRLERAVAHIKGGDASDRRKLIATHLASKEGPLATLQSLLIDLQLAGAELPGSLVAASKALALAEGVALKLDPNVTQSGLIGALLRQAMRRRVRTAKVAKGIVRTLETRHGDEVLTRLGDELKRSEKILADHDAELRQMEAKLAAARVALAKLSARSERDSPPKKKGARLAAWWKALAAKKAPTDAAPIAFGPVWERPSEAIERLTRQLESGRRSYNIKTTRDRAAKLRTQIRTLRAERR